MEEFSSPWNPPAIDIDLSSLFSECSSDCFSLRDSVYSSSEIFDLVTFFLGLFLLFGVGSKQSIVEMDDHV